MKSVCLVDRFCGVLLCGVALFAGCAISGTWRVDKVTPATQFGIYPHTMITFDDNAMTYAAATGREESSMESVGGYDWDGFKLTLRPKGKPERAYKGYRTWGRLVLHGSAGGKDFKATLVRDEIPEG